MKAHFARFLTKDKIELQGFLYLPRRKVKKAIIHVHGMAGNFYENYFLDEMAKQYTKAGHGFLSFNNRGHDYFADLRKKEKDKVKLVKGGGAFEIFEDCLLDINAAIDFAQEKGFEKFILQGHSLGAVKVAYFQGKTNHKDVIGLVLISFADMIALGKDDKNFKNNLKLAKRLVKEGKGKEILLHKIWDEYYLSAKTFLNFFTSGNEIDVFNFYGKDKKSKILNKITIPVLAILGEKDDVILHGNEFKILRKKLPNAKSVTTKTIKGAEHSYAGFEKELTRTVMRWLELNM